MLENSGFLDLFDRPHSALPTQLAPQLLETPVVVEMKINFHSYTQKKKKKIDKQNKYGAGRMRNRDITTRMHFQEPKHLS
jgi:hypothetical protein